MAKILIAGCGDVGLALARVLGARGHEIWGLRRSAAELPQPLRLVRADLAQAASLQALPRALDFVFYLASADGASDEAYRAAYVKNLQNLLDALRARGETPKRIFYASSTSVYAQADDEWVDEQAGTQPEHFSGKRLLEGEAVLRAAGFASCIVRFSGIYGVTKRALLERVARGERSKSEDSPYTNRIHVSDCAGALAHLVTLDEPAALYLASDCEPARRADVESWIEAELKRRNSSVLSQILVQGGLRRTAADRVSRRRSSSKRCCNARLLAAGYAFRYPSFREGYTAILDEIEAMPGVSAIDTSL